MMQFNLNDPGPFLEAKYDIKCTFKQLAGYQDLNYLVNSVSGEKFILKLSTDPADIDFIRSQNRILAELSKGPVGGLLPVPVQDIHGEYLNEIQINGVTAYARLFRFIEGDFLAESSPGKQFYFELGNVFALIDHGMAGLEDAVLKCRTHDWELSRVLELREDISLIKDPLDRRLTHYFLMKYREEVFPVIHKLPMSLIHGDGNDWNILFRADSVCGVIDFGDMVWGPRINEVAVVLAYAMMGRPDFEEIYHSVIDGYSKTIPLTEMELSILHWLVAARWCQTMVMAARRAAENPESKYHQVSVAGARDMLDKWIRRNPRRGIQLTPPMAADQGTQGRDNRYEYFSRAVSLSYKAPIHMTGAAMQYMYSADGKTYLDCVNNIPHVGHCHPRVVEAGQRQMACLNTNTRYLYDSLDRYAVKLLSKFPSSLNKLFLVNSGSAATDLAVRLAEAFTGNTDYLVLDYAYHGNTKAAIGLSPYKFNRKGGKGRPDNITILPTGPDADVKQVFAGKEGRPLTFFAESIVGCAGQIVLDTAIMQQTVGAVRSAGGLYVADEVQTGFGRVGHKFWGFELYDVVPDIVILGKPMGNGHPMGAVVCTEAVARSFETGMEFFSSFGGNPVSCEIGLAVLQVIEEEALQENARLVGDYLREKLAVGSLQSAVGSRQSAGGREAGFRVKEVRGSGLFLGIEIVESDSGKPATEAAISIVEEMKEIGILLSTDGPYNNVIKIKPPLCFSMQNADELADALLSRLTAG